MRRRNKGFTLVEVVIAVTIAVIVSVAAASVIISTKTTTKEAKYKNNAVSYANNVMEIFKASENMADLQKGLEFSYLDKGSDGDPVGSIDVDSDNSDYRENDGKMFYLYMNKDGTLYKTDAEQSGTKTVETDWNRLKTQECKYVIAVNIAKCKTGNAFKASTELNVVVYKVISLYANEPNASDVANDANVVYTMSYVKGVAD